MWLCRALREHPHHPPTAPSLWFRVEGGGAFSSQSHWLCLYSTCCPHSVDAGGHHVLTVACEVAAQHDGRIRAPRQQPPSPDVSYQGVCLTSSCLRLFRHSHMFAALPSPALSPSHSLVCTVFDRPGSAKGGH